MALEEEIWLRQTDLNEIQQLGQQILLASSTVDQAPGILGPVASTIAGYSQQLTALAATVQDPNSASQAIFQGSEIWQQAQQLLPALIPVDQAGQIVSQLAQERFGGLQRQWLTVHGSPQSSFSDILWQNLTSYAQYLAQVVADAHATLDQPPPPPPPLKPPFPPPPFPPPLFPPPPFPPPTDPAAVVAWLKSSSTSLDTLSAAISTGVAHLTTTGSWSNVEAAVTAPTTLAQTRLATVQRIAAALTVPPSDAATLGGLLSQLSDLRLGIYPDPVLPSDRGTYQQRMVGFDRALMQLLAAASIGGGTPAPPIAMLPVRLETRTFPGAAGGTEFRIRVYVDDIHVNAHDPRLTKEESDWSAQAQSELTNSPATAKATWAQLASHFGPARAAYLLNPDRSAGTRTTPWARPAIASGLPDRWLAIGYGLDGLPLNAALGGQISGPLHVGPDPGLSPTPVTPPLTPTDDLTVDPELRWMIDFDEAVRKGMGIRLTVDGGAAGPPDGPGPRPVPGLPPTSPQKPGPPTLSRLLVVGVKAGDATNELTELLKAHHYTNGMELVTHSTPTNNTADAPAGFSSSDPGYDRSYRLEIGDAGALVAKGFTRPAPSGDAARLAAALGLHGPGIGWPGVDSSVFGAAGDVLVEQADQQAMTALAWPATWGTFLTRMAGMAGPHAELLGSWAVAWLRPGGPLPSLRVRARPYGILPIVALGQWTDPLDLAATDVYGIVHRLLPNWLNSYATVVRPLDFDALLARRPVSVEARARFAGSLPGWLQTGYGLLGVSSSVINANLADMPNRLALIGQAAGLPTPLPWPSGFMTLPEASHTTDSWPLIKPEGSLPLVSETGSGNPDDADNMSALLGVSPPPVPKTLLEYVARQSWNATGVVGVSGTFNPRGNIINDPARPEPTPPPAVELYGAVSYLAARHDANFAQLLGGALDVTSHRIDAWATALATSRLSQLRTAERKANAAPVTLVGGFGWVENLKGRLPLRPANPPVPDEPAALDDAANLGFLHAPSLQQATTAAVLRSGYLTHNPSTGTPPGSTAPFAIDLSSRRARLAGWILDGMRQGQALSALLGYRFERALQEAGLGELIDAFRQAAPYDPAAPPNGSANTPAEAVRASDVVDGVALLRLFQAQPPPSGLMWTRALGPLMELEEAADAVGDAVIAQAVHDSLTGSTHAAAATFDAMATGSVPAPPLKFLSTPRTGVGIAHRVLVPAPTAVRYPPAGWPDTPRGRGEPALSSWVASLLGDPSQTTAEVSLLDPAGAPLPGPPVPITLAVLGLGPLDVLALSRHPSEIERLAVHSVLAGRQPSDPASSDGGLLDHPVVAVRPLSAVLAVAHAANQLIGAGRAADARDLAPSGTQIDPGVDLGDMAIRVNGPNGVLAALAAGAAALGVALPGDPAPGSGQTIPSGVPIGADPAVLASALVMAVLLGIPNAAPAGTGPAFLSALVGQARAAWSEIVRRQNAIRAAEPPPLPAPPTPSDNGTTLAARLAQLTIGFGESFRALPHILANDLAQAAALTQVDETDAGQGPEAWLVKAGRVHQGVADLLDTCRAAEALLLDPLTLGARPEFELTVAQLPVSTAAARWVGLPFVGAPPTANTLSLTIVGRPAPPAGTLAALLVADWVEVIPSAREITGLTYHYDAPTSQAPQSILLAVPARPEPTTWSYNDLIDTVGTALDLAHARAVEFSDLQWQLRQVLPAAYFANRADASPILPVTTPGNYLNQEVGPPTITSVDPVNLKQKQVGGLIVVRGANFLSLSPNAFSVDGGGVTVTPLSVTDTVATLRVNVSESAALGQRGVKAGTFDFPSAPVTITPVPQAVSCDTLRLSQGMADVVIKVTVTGHLLIGAGITLAGTSQDVSRTVTYTVVTSEPQVVISVTIVASNYDPYQDVAASGGTPYIKPHPYRAPVHVNVPLTLTVTPINGAPAIFPMTLDEIR